MAARMTVQQAADLWRVNRRTVLKWIMGKDSTGRGKRLIEGEDYEVVDGDVEGRKMYVLLRETYPVPTNTTPIPRIPRGRREPREEAVEVPAAPVRTRYEQAVPEDVAPAANRYAVIDAERHPVESIRVEPTPEVVVPAEPEVVVPPTAEAAAERFAVQQEVKPPRPKVRRPKREMEIPTIDTYLPTERDRPEDVEPSPVVVRRKPIPPDPSYVGKSIKEQLTNWILTMTNDPDEQEKPLFAASRIILREVADDAGVEQSPDVADLGQEQVEAYLRRILNASPMDETARNYAGGMVLEYINAIRPKFKLHETRSEGGYWPKMGQLSGLRFVDPVPVELSFAPYEWA